MALQGDGKCHASNTYGYYPNASDTECQTACSMDPNVKCGGLTCYTIYKVLPLNDHTVTLQMKKDGTDLDVAPALLFDHNTVLNALTIDTS